MAKSLKNCGTCYHWESRKKSKGECLETGELLEPTETCSKHQYNPSEACTLCGGTVIEEEEYSGFSCTENPYHFASMWDYEWVSFDL